MKKLIKSRIFIVTLSLLFIFLIISGVTYAWFTWTSTDNTNITMEVGEYTTITFSEGNNINVNNLTPVYNYTDGEATTFSITNNDNNVDRVYHYNVYLDITTIANELKDSTFKYVLLDSSSNIIDEGNFSEASNNTTLVVTSSKVLSSGTTSYTFIIYIDGNEENNPNMINKTLKGKLRVVVNGGQIASTYISDLYTNATKTTYTDSKYNIIYNYATSVNLMNDRLGSMETNIDAGNIRYYGGNPNNYVLFNNELWRIIGVFNGKLKIIRNESIGSFSWDTSGADVNNGYGINQWGPSTHSTDNSAYDGADLMKLLNPGYENNMDKNCVATGGVTRDDLKYNCGDNTDSNYENVLVNNSLYWSSRPGRCYDYGNYRTKTCNFTNTGLKAEAKSMIVSEVWHLGTNSKNVDPYNGQMTASKLYEWEHSDNSGIQCTQNATYCSTDVIGTTTWTGKVGLMSPSDYAYATGGGSHGLNTCLSKHAGYVSDNTIQNWNNTYTGCINDDWIYNNTYQWTLVAYGTTNTATAMFNIYNNGIVDSTYVNNVRAVRPVVRLNSNTIISSGIGTSTDPYVLN